MGGRLNILTHHKCASTWLGRYLHEFCGLNSLKLAGTHYSNLTLDRSADVTACINASYEFVRDNLDEGIHVIRNPLDIVVSAYYSHRNTHPLDGWPELASQRQILQAVSEREGMFLTLAFLERDDFYSGAVGPLHALRHWNFDDERFCTLRMEDIVLDPELVLGSILKSRFPDSILPPADNHTFEAVSGRQIGKIDDNSHYRSGKADQWKEVLPDAIISYVRIYFASILERFYPDSIQISSPEPSESISLKNDPS
jgi:hypothetical protein